MGMAVPCSYCNITKGDEIHLSFFGRWKFHSKKMHLKLYEICRPFCSGLNVLIFAEVPIMWLLYIVKMFCKHFYSAMCIQFTRKSRLNGLLDNQSRHQITFDNGGGRYFRGSWLTVTAVGLKWTNLPTADHSILLAPNELLGASSLQICYYSSTLRSIFLHCNKSLILFNIMPVEEDNLYQPNKFSVTIIYLMTLVHVVKKASSAFKRWFFKLKLYQGKSYLTNICELRYVFLLAMVCFIKVDNRTPDVTIVKKDGVLGNWVQCITADRVYGLWPSEAVMKLS